MRPNDLDNDSIKARIVNACKKWIAKEIWAQPLSVRALCDLLAEEALEIEPSTMRFLLASNGIDPNASQRKKAYAIGKKSKSQ